MPETYRAGTADATVDGVDHVDHTMPIDGFAVDGHGHGESKLERRTCFPFRKAERGRIS